MSLIDFFSDNPVTGIVMGSVSIIYLTSVARTAYNYYILSHSLPRDEEDERDFFLGADGSYGRLRSQESINKEVDRKLREN